MLGSGRVEFLPNCEYVGDRHVRLAHLRTAVRGAGAVPDRRRPLPRPRHPGEDAAAVRGRRRRAGRPGQRPRRGWRRRRASTSSSGLGQDRDRRLHLAAGARRRPGRDLLGAAPRPVDAQPRAWSSPIRPCSSAWSPTPWQAAERRGVAGRPVPAAGGRRGHAAHRPRRSRRPWRRRRPSATWELDLLRTHRARRPARARPTRCGRGGSTFDEGSVAVAPTTRSSCTAPRPACSTRRCVPIWGPDAITLQPIRAGFPCFGAALAGYVEATRDDDAEKNRLCPPSPLPEHAWPTGRG